jgi:hypothetical protein
MPSTSPIPLRYRSAPLPSLAQLAIARQHSARSLRSLAANIQAIQHRHPYEDVRDTSLYYPLRKLPNVKVTHEGQYPSLKVLCREVLGEDGFQEGEHCPVSLFHCLG